MYIYSLTETVNEAFKTEYTLGSSNLAADNHRIMRSKVTWPISEQRREREKKKIGRRKNTIVLCLLTLHFL